VVKLLREAENEGTLRVLPMLTVSQLSKSFAGRALFDDVSLQVNRGDRIGLVGPNAAGKSTLFALLLGDVSPDNGTIAIEKNATIGFLPQETGFQVRETLSAFVGGNDEPVCTRTSPSILSNSSWKASCTTGEV
jgi:ATPase subunit of ABC transporter with duplicated ATPase domains